MFMVYSAREPVAKVILYNDPISDKLRATTHALIHTETSLHQFDKEVFCLYKKIAPLESTIKDLKRQRKDISLMKTTHLRHLICLLPYGATLSADDLDILLPAALEIQQLGIN